MYLSALHYYEKIPDRKRQFKEDSFVLVHSFTDFAPWSHDLIAFGAAACQHKWRAHGRADVHLMLNKEGKGRGKDLSHNPLGRHAPSDLSLPTCPHF
jgi:hypothetical protein